MLLWCCIFAGDEIKKAGCFYSSQVIFLLRLYEKYNQSQAVIARKEQWLKSCFPRQKKMLSAISFQCDVRLT